MGQNNHSGHWGINPPSKTPPFLAKPPSKPTNCPSSPLFRQSPPIYWFFKMPPLKVGSFSEPPKY